MSSFIEWVNLYENISKNICVNDATVDREKGELTRILKNAWNLHTQKIPFIVNLIMQTPLIYFVLQFVKSIYMFGSNLLLKVKNKKIIKDLYQLMKKVLNLKLKVSTKS